jgi:hypothetical protein
MYKIIITLLILSIKCYLNIKLERSFKIRGKIKAKIGCEWQIIKRWYMLIYCVYTLINERLLHHFQLCLLLNTFFIDTSSFAYVLLSFT